MRCARMRGARRAWAFASRRSDERRVGAAVARASTGHDKAGPPQHLHDVAPSRRFLRALDVHLSQLMPLKRPRATVDDGLGQAGHVDLDVISPDVTKTQAARARALATRS